MCPDKDWVKLLHAGDNWTRFLTGEQEFCECCTEHFGYLNVGDFLTKRAAVSFLKDSGSMEGVSSVSRPKDV